MKIIWAAHTLSVPSPSMPERMVRAFHYNRCRNTPTKKNCISPIMFRKAIHSHKCKIFILLLYIHFKHNYRKKTSSPLPIHRLVVSPIHCAYLLGNNIPYHIAIQI